MVKLLFSPAKALRAVAGWRKLPSPDPEGERRIALEPRPLPTCTLDRASARPRAAGKATSGGHRKGRGRVKIFCQYLFAGSLPFTRRSWLHEALLRLRFF